ncbi:MAG: aminotransferase class V-fold PLP-dependent enzyme [Dehalococcoidia bacterium]
MTQRCAYMNCGWSGPMSNAVVAAMSEQIEREASLGPEAGGVMNESQRAIAGRLREATATLLGADPAEVAITGNTTQGMNAALNGVGAGAGDVVVTTNIEHGGGIIPAYYLRERVGVDLRIVPIGASDSRGEIVERFSKAMEGGARAVLLSEISYATGQLLPLAEIVRLAHERGAVVIADGAQTAGQCPVDVQALGVDAYAITPHKWLCGPDGLGMLYVRRERIPQLQPTMLGLGEAVSYDDSGFFALDGARMSKFEVSTLSSALMAGALAAIQQYQASGPAAVWERVRELSGYALQRFEGLAGVTIRSARAAEARTGLFVFTVDGVDPDAVVSALREGGVVGRRTKDRDTARLCFHVYNTEAEIDRAAEIVARGFS